ncbi:Zinc-finger double domain family protein [Acanthocheilonema viteae]
MVSDEGNLPMKELRNSHGITTMANDIKARKKQFKCCVCDRELGSAGSLYNHKKIHIDEKHKCDLCNKVFTLRCNLERHKRTTHTNERQSFECDECHKKFTRKFDLKMHERRHTKVQPFEYDEYHKKFTRKDYLYRHVLTQHPPVKSSTTTANDISAAKKLIKKIISFAAYCS